MDRVGLKAPVGGTLLPLIVLAQLTSTARRGRRSLLYWRWVCDLQSPHDHALVV